MTELADTRRNKAVVRGFDELVRGGDPADLDELCTPDMINHALAETRAPGLAGTREFLLECRRDARRAAWKAGFRLRDERLIADGDMVAQFGVLAAVWPGGRFRGVQTESGPYETEVAFIYRLVDGRIAERWAVRDDLGMMLQLGAIR